MSSANEQLAPAAKPRISPLELRNTDLVSRLLAATPPYLYNMSLLPNTYFFSEMLRSLVQAKAESARTSIHHRRSRKRPWAHAASTDVYHKSKPDPTSPDWMLKSHHSAPKLSELPLELTTAKHSPGIDRKQSQHQLSSAPDVKMDYQPEAKPDLMILPNHMNMFSSPNQSEPNGNVLLPPPPPPGPTMWYPPLYPTPYGIDPLHFFIDLRVSGHIYDKKNQKELSESSASATETSSSTMKDDHNVDQASDAEVSREQPIRDRFKVSKHTSAFSVPVPRTSKPMNLSSEAPKSLKFDVKSMGFENNTSQKRSTNYIMSNLADIYKSITGEGDQKVKEESQCCSTDPEEQLNEEERQRRKKLRALIGLELVVDYMSHGQGQGASPDLQGSTTDAESQPSSPALEVVAVGDGDDSTQDRHEASDAYT